MPEIKDHSRGAFCYPKGQGMKFSKEIRDQVLAKSGGKCWYCGTSLTGVLSHISPSAFCIDHADPKSNGGGHGIQNLFPVCRSCNSKKKNRSIEQYRNYIEWKRVTDAAGVNPFSEDQRAYLERIRVKPPGLIPHYFWFEKNNLRGRR